MRRAYLYADQASLEALSSDSQKILLIGGDFGYGNFGDLLQHIGSGRVAKQSKSFATVSVMAANAIGFADFPLWARRFYASDAIVFLSEYPLMLDEDSPRLNLVCELRNVAAIHLYGGGFLNGMWGDYVLGVAEYFLRLAPDAQYFVSGQQITPPYQHRVVEHIKTFKPSIFGVRDEVSRLHLADAGFDPSFSFDDATESLIDLTKRLPLQSGEGVLLHLNCSNYTGNALAESDLAAALDRLRLDARSRAGVTLFQAYRDARLDVMDSRETVKKLDIMFPFNDVRLIELAFLPYEESAGLSAPIVGEVGYSCSYHVALWLQLAGIPCWLRSNNPFYDQKSKALQVTQDFGSFLDEPRLADHSTNLERRAQWRESFIKALLDVPEVQQIAKVPVDAAGPAPWPFFYKGTPTLEDRLNQVTQEANDSRARANVAATNLSQAQAEALAMGERVAALQVQVREVEGVAHAQVERIEALTAQLTEVGSEAHRQRERAEGAEGLLNRLQTDLMDVRQRLAATESNLRQLFVSRSWRLTRPLRGLARYVRHGHIDSEGNVGWFALAQKVGRRLPVSAELRRRLGSFLSRLRRKG